MRLVFDHVQQGLLMVDLDGSLNPEHSAILERWLGAPRASDTLASWFGRADGAFSQWLAVGWSQLVEDVMPREVSLALLPRRVRAGDVTLEVQWQAVDANGRLERVLLVVSDITERLSRERADLAQRELLDVFDHLNRDRTGFLEFFAEGRALVETLRGATLPPHLELLRAVHTLKGNCAFFGFSSVAQACHEAEGRAAETEDAQVDVEVAATVCAAWDAASARAIRFLDETRGVIEIEERDYAAIVRAIHEGASSARVLQLIESWKYEPVKKRFQRLGEQACSLARRLNKGELQIASEDHDVRLPRDRFARLFTVLPHIVRNAVDHGLESRGDPACSGKQPWLRFTCVQNVDELVLSVADNGAGIDWAAVAARARALGYDADDPAVLQQALFLDGLSTREEASDVSGRGLGMAAVREACEALGGRVIVDSQPGAGTCISLHVPTKGPHA
jgi:two-component system chemotaxis sensor kinase CheA